MIYFIGRQHAPDRIKIGKTKDIHRRLQQLQVGNPDRLICHRLLREKDYSESEIHQLFNTTRIEHLKDGDSEWFRCPTNSRLWKYLNGKAKIRRKESGKLELVSTKPRKTPTRKTLLGSIYFGLQKFL